MLADYKPAGIFQVDRGTVLLSHRVEIKEPSLCLQNETISNTMSYDPVSQEVQHNGYLCFLRLSTLQLLRYTLHPHTR